MEDFPVFSGLWLHPSSIDMDHDDFSASFLFSETDKTVITGNRRAALVVIGALAVLVAAAATFAIGHDYNKTPTKEIAGFSIVVAIGVAIPFAVAFLLS